MQFIGLFLEKNNPKPLYMQLYEFLVAEIRSGHLACGEHLLGKRSAALHLGLSVNTVDRAYQMLVDEGYVQARPRSGFWVNDLGPLLPLPLAPATTPVADFAEKAASTYVHYSFLSGGIDSTLFLRKTWNRLSKEVLSSSLDLFSKGESYGDFVLRKAIADYLRGFRGVQCTPEQVVMGAGLEVLLARLSPLLPQGAIALENPGYAKTSRLFQNVGRDTTALNVDEKGMCIQALVQNQVGVCYVTPSHQFPSGFVMPAPRRAELLHWAAEHNGLIIEDDYDSEFRFSGRPLPSLQSMDRQNRVVYAGTFSRSLAPGIRASYLVLPPKLLEAWQNHYHDYACTIWRPEQHTLARFISEGHFSRRLNSVRLCYRQRLTRILSLLEQGLPKSSYQCFNTHTGLYFILKLHNCHASKLANEAAEKNLEIRALSHYAQQGSAGFSLWQGGHDALVLGYGGLPDANLDEALHSLISVMQNHLSHKHR